MGSRLIVLLTAIAWPVLAAAQDSAAYRAPRTEHGAPDLQGYWEKRFATPVQRPVELGNRRAYTEAEAAEF